MVRRIKNLLHFLNACLATIYYGYPAQTLKVVGITGTDGKTTTAHILYHILTNAGIKAALISSVAAYIGGKVIETGFHVTTPSPWRLQKLLKKAKDNGCKVVVLEVTSHALDQQRTVGASVDIGVITNVSHEHLDYHKNLPNYMMTKSKIFHGVKVSILNRDDNSFKTIKKSAQGKVITYSLDHKADYRSSSLFPNQQTDYQASYFSMHLAIPGKFNLYNALSASVTATILKIPKKTIEKALHSFHGVQGRMENITTRDKFTVLVDFAHKINALDNALLTARKMTHGKLIAVFGCAGLRDTLKRPIMGEIAAKRADLAVLTAEDPRTEDVRTIIDAIALGCQKGGMKEGSKKANFNPKSNGRKYFYRIPDRQEAINFAIRRLAHRGDTVIICGKGHEKSMCWGKVEYPWDEHKAIEKALLSRH